MTSGGFNVTVTDFAAEAPKFADAGSDITNASNKQSGVLDGLGDFWGTTAHGPDFGKEYQPKATQVLALAKACGIAVSGIGDGLTGMGKQYGITEQQIAQALQGPLGEIPGAKKKGEGAN